ncbi:WecB/TagA/CpsF family glycosyltransferase [Dorea acetigenes]|uniref:WecB/TagA/CpsF family glycosyltransferase n=1 Tax=Dorea acetigenes TaxID=2981787 RepID=A0ABT2RPR0_9FIRM|nr:WecB/TagA/CpsF family glycosyltransferase [Dorea acetigenes]MCB6416297.1 WecB/TagA/CpsF family glycosyltransferase [Faecalimonas umbilicata]MCU6687358.1 WecB/TagA/CpsF family glycosyltransferase [Dorea acetigenes]SCJ38699.1 glycosyltransferase%2C WecB/TagA/CpsF family [uncultured Clostridium sp.]
MNEKISVLDVAINGYTAKKAMKETVDYMHTEPLNIIEMVTVDTLMYAKEEPELRESMSQLDMVLPGEKEILEGAGITDRRRLQEVEEQTYLRMFFRYLHKNHCRVFLLVETDEEAQAFYKFLNESYAGIQITGMAKVSAEDKGDELVVNAVNGDEVDCVIAALSAPIREEFAENNKHLLNARVWLGVGKMLKMTRQDGSRKMRFVRFMTHRFFKREIQKNRKE